GANGIMTVWKFADYNMRHVKGVKHQGGEKRYQRYSRQCARAKECSCRFAHISRGECQIPKTQLFRNCFPRNEFEIVRRSFEKDHRETGNFDCREWASYSHCS